MYAREFNEFGPLGRSGSPFRAGRGMMEPAILQALHEKPMHGYEIISYLEEKSHGVWRPSPGSVYPTLQLLEEKDLVEYTEQAGKKTYQLTNEGKHEAEAAKEHLRKAFERFSDIDQLEGRRMNLRHDYQRQFHKQAGEIFKLLRRIFRKGSTHQKADMDEAINDFKDRLEQIWKGEIE